MHTSQTTTQTLFKGGKLNMKLGKTAIQVSKQGLGCMSMSEFYGTPLAESDAINLISTAFENGVNMFDTADVYGFGRNEELVGKAISKLVRESVERAKIVIATKCGIIRDENDTTKRGIDNSFSYIKQACDLSLKRLGTDVGYIDLFYIHRVVNDGEKIDESMQAMADLLAEGKIKSVGLSEANAHTIRRANTKLVELTNGVHQLAAVQTEYSLMSRRVENNDVLKTCRELDITFVAYSPLSRALLTGIVETSDDFEENDFRRTLPRFQKENLVHNNKIVSTVKKIAEEKGCSTAQISLAWLMHQSNVLPIPGTTKETHLLSNIHSESIVLEEDNLTQLSELGCAQGYRYTEAAMKAYGFEDEIDKEIEISINQK
jgi:aryl-alcohol dehydrogenase-like predicted oxidoreductase